MDKTFDFNLCRVIAGRRYKKFGEKKKCIKLLINFIKLLKINNFY